MARVVKVVGTLPLMARVIKVVGTLPLIARDKVVGTLLVMA